MRPPSSVSTAAERIAEYRTPTSLPDLSKIWKIKKLQEIVPSFSFLILSFH
jgi:hypothetical protein